MDYLKVFCSHPDKARADTESGNWKCNVCCVVWIKAEPYPKIEIGYCEKE